MGEVLHKKDLKVEIPGEAKMTLPVEAASAGAATGGGGGGLARQGSVTKNNCLCSPTTHAGSFRCRLHRSPPSLQRTKSIDSSTALQDPQSKEA
ncbi:hypothetical protein ACH5RR_035578 [Cinchona calisaya]|uniref:Serine-rich protein n=1 Tax=Cinchona calisaya TaxID=153742 RepID=A0ABD2Y451_9GENT